MDLRGTSMSGDNTSAGIEANLDETTDKNDEQVHLRSSGMNALDSPEEHADEASLWFLKCSPVNERLGTRLGELPASSGTMGK